MAGFLRVDKPEGPTSHDVVASARRALGTRRIGHTGTLDPFASGLLLLALGTATRLIEFLSDLDKEYRAVARLGVRTDTHDREGTVVSESDAWREVTPEAIEAALEPLRGTILQEPPAFSAKKLGGEPAHRKARRGEAVSLPAVPVTVHEIRIEQIALPDVTLRVRCSTGTYVRALARDLGEALGVGAHLRALRRERIGSFTVDRAPGPDALDDPARVEAGWITPLEALAHLTRVEIDAVPAARLGHGESVSMDDVEVLADPVGPNGATARGAAREGFAAGARPPAGSAPSEGAPVVVSVDGRLLAVAERSGTRLRPRKVFHPPER